MEPTSSDIFVTPQETLLAPWLVGMSTDHPHSHLGFGVYFPEVVYWKLCSNVIEIAKSSLIEAPVLGRLGKRKNAA